VNRATVYIAQYYNVKISSFLKKSGVAHLPTPGDFIDDGTIYLSCLASSEPNGNLEDRSKVQYPVVCVPLRTAAGMLYATCVLQVHLFFSLFSLFCSLVIGLIIPWSICLQLALRQYFKASSLTSLSVLLFHLSI
jgi:hypothetical protein